MRSMNSRISAATTFLRPTILLLALGVATQAGAQGATAPVVRSDERHDLSPPLRSIPPGPAALSSGVTNATPQWPARRRLDSVAADPAIDGGPATTLMPSPLLTFEGVNNVNSVLPPDPVGDIGPNHYVQVVNLSFAIFDRNGTVLFGPANVNTLWTGFGGACETTNNGNPIVLYDALADRWLISQPAALSGATTGPYFECIAISQTADPTAAWHRYAFAAHATKRIADAKLGAWIDGYYMSAHQFNPAFTAFLGAGVWAFERERMLQGLSAQMVYFDLVAADANIGLLPADLDGPAPPAGTPHYFASVDEPPFVPSDRINLWQFAVDWTTPANSTFGLAGEPNQFLETAPFDMFVCTVGECVPQPGTAQKLDVHADRLMFRLQDPKLRLVLHAGG